MTEKTCLDFNTLARLCPLGWVELQVEHHPGDSGPGGNTPQEPDTCIHLARVWGLTPDDVDGVNAALDELHRDAEVFCAIARKAPHLGLLLRRIVLRPAICPSCKAVVEDKRRFVHCPCGVSFVAPIGLEEVEGA